jgi:hypothetical protein
VIRWFDRMREHTLSSVNPEKLDETRDRCNGVVRGAGGQKRGRLRRPRKLFSDLAKQGLDAADIPYQFVREIVPFSNV